jgi:signal-transduction protein with cAMP-binding, CBS, and nucleotidyltransferase domain
LFKNEEIIIKKIITNLEIQLYKPEDELIKQNDTTADLFFLTKGYMEVFITNDSKMKRFVR